MPEAPHFPSDTNPGQGPRDDNWHDLVAAVVSVKGSPPVCPPAAMLTGLERKLGFDSKPAVWWRAPRFLGGMAAALAVMAGGLAWRAGAPKERLTSIANVSGAGAGIALQTKPEGNEMSVLSAESNPIQTHDNRLAPVVVAPGATSHPGQFSLAGPSRIASREGNNTGRGGLRAGSTSYTGEIPAAADASFGEAEGLIDLKSDYYVVGIIAAAMQSPVTANPFEYSLQPAEWSDWRSGYELGRQLPPTEALALGETWTWDDPENLSLVVGIGDPEPDAAAAVATPGLKDPPETLAGSAAAGEVAAPPSGIQPPPPDGAASGESVAKKNGAE